MKARRCGASDQHHYRSEIYLGGIQMSYDLMVFEPSRAPRERKEFIDWFEQQVQWSEDHEYNDPSVCSESLQRFYSELSKHFPNMNVDDEIEESGTEDRLTDYSLGSAVIYAAFAYSVAKEAYTTMRNLAIKHKVGFFDVSTDDGEIIFPD
jgi:predicted DNA binding CopG/RHH family protein